MSLIMDMITKLPNELKQIIFSYNSYIPFERHELLEEYNRRDNKIKNITFHLSLDFGIIVSEDIIRRIIYNCRKKENIVYWNRNFVNLDRNLILRNENIVWYEDDNLIIYE